MNGKIKNEENPHFILNHFNSTESYLIWSLFLRHKLSHLSFRIRFNISFPIFLFQIIHGLEINYRARNIPNSSQFGRRLVSGQLSGLGWPATHIQSRLDSHETKPEFESEPSPSSFHLPKSKTHNPIWDWHYLSSLSSMASQSF